MSVTQQFRPSVKFLICACFLALIVIPHLPVEAYTLPDTGQTKCYDNSGEIPCPAPGERFYGQDAQYRGPQPAHRDNGDGASYTLNDGLVAYYPFNGNADDESGNGNHGTINNAVFVGGKLGLGLEFSGDLSSYVEVPHSDSLSPSTAITISLWARENTASPAYSSLIYKAGGEPIGWCGDRTYSLWTTSSAGIHLASTPEGSTNQTYCNSPSGVYGLGEFFHVVGVINTTDHTMRTYVNGVKVQECPYAGDQIRSGNYPLRIGGHFHYGGDQYNFNGIIDEVRIYNRALSEAEVYQLYSGSDQAWFGYYSNLNNPNGQWSFGWKASIDGTLNLYDTNVADYRGEHWVDAQHCAPYPELIPNLRKNTSPGILYGVAPGEVAIHPGFDGEFSVVRWTAPNTGTFRVEGVFGAGDIGSMSYYILQNGAMKYQQINDPLDGIFSFVSSVVQGEQIDFIVGPNTDILGDHAGWNGSTPLRLMIAEATELTIAQTPMSGPPGTTFVEWGTGFTPNSTATLHFKKPDGTEYPTRQVELDSIGHFEITYPAPWDKPPGTYTWWAIDDTSGGKSNVVSYVIEGRIGELTRFVVLENGGDIGAHAVGEWFEITVTGRDDAGNVIQDFNDQVSLSDLTGTLQPSSVPLKNGTWSGSVAVRYPHSNDQISAAYGGISGSSNPFQVGGSGCANTIGGWVQDRDRKPLSNASVLLRAAGTSQSQAVAMTNEDGTFKFGSRPCGKYEMYAVWEGHTSPLQVVDNTATEAEIKLKVDWLDISGSNTPVILIAGFLGSTLDSKDSPKNFYAAWLPGKVGDSDAKLVFNGSSVVGWEKLVSELKKAGHPVYELPWDWRMSVNTRKPMNAIMAVMKSA